MLTVDFDRLGLLPGDRALDMGCGAGRHAFEMYRRGADVIAFDQDADELAKVSDMFAEMRRAGEVPGGAEADVKEGDALVLDTPVATEQYRVEWIRITTPEDVSVIDATPGRAVTLVGCYPFYHVGPAPQRFIVRAVPAPGSPGG